MGCLSVAGVNASRAARRPACELPHARRPGRAPSLCGTSSPRSACLDRSTPRQSTDRGCGRALSGGPTWSSASRRRLRSTRPGRRNPALASSCAGSTASGAGVGPWDVGRKRSATFAGPRWLTILGDASRITPGWTVEIVAGGSARNLVQALQVPLALSDRLPASGDRA